MVVMVAKLARVELQDAEVWVIDGGKATECNTRPSLPSHSLGQTQVFLLLQLKGWSRKGLFLILYCWKMK